jgi:hypothetical protein
MVSALADARRAAAALQKRGQNLAPWLTTEIRLRGIRENAAVVAALEIAAVRDSVATLYRQRYPERTVQLDQFLAHIND